MAKVEEEKRTAKIRSTVKLRRKIAGNICIKVNVSNEARRVRWIWKDVCAVLIFFFLQMEMETEKKRPCQ